MFDFLTRGGVAFYLAHKNGWSYANDAMRWFDARKPVPRMPSPAAAWEYMAKLPYTGDPLGGAGDFYTHPERIVAALASGTVKNLSIDCDDFALLAHCLTRQTPGCTSRMLTLVDASGRFGHHVICVGVFNGQPWAIDTTGYRTLPDLTETTICRVWTEIYASLGYRYTLAVDTPSPW